MHFTGTVSNTSRARNYHPPDESERIESTSRRLEVYDFRVDACSRSEVKFSLPREKTEELSERIRPLVSAIFEFDEKTKEGNYVNFHVSRARRPDMLTNDDLKELATLGAVPAPVMRKVAVVGHPFSSLEVADYRNVAQVVNWLFCKRYLSREDGESCMRQTDILCKTALLAEQIQLKAGYKEALKPQITSIMKESRNAHIAHFWLDKMIDILLSKGLTPELGYDMVSGKDGVFKAFEATVGVKVECAKSLFILGCYYIDPILFEEAYPHFAGCDSDNFRNVLWSSLQDNRLPNKKQQVGVTPLVAQVAITCDMATFKITNMAHVPHTSLRTKQENVLDQIKGSAYFFEGTHRQIVAKLDKAPGSYLLGPIEGDIARLVLYFYNMNQDLECLRLKVDPQGAIFIGPFKIDNLEVFLLQKHFLLPDKKLLVLKTDDAKIAKEFEQVSKEVFPQEYCKASLDKRVNRGGNTALPYDNNRVRLLGEGYINASLVKMADGISYVCAQGPYKDAKCDSTVEFWQMVWQHNTPVMLMLTELAANDKTHCSKYWPDVDAKSVVYGKISVKCIDEQLRYCGGSQDHEEALSFRVFKLSREGHKPRFVYLFKYENWQEGQGANVNLVKRLIRDTNYQRAVCGITRPLLVHSSLGIGRTGTFVALHHLLEQMQHHKEQPLNIQDTVRALRNPKSGRPGMVQTLAQYQFLYKVLTENDKK